MPVKTSFEIISLATAEADSGSILDQVTEIKKWRPIGRHDIYQIQQIMRSELTTSEHGHGKADEQSSD